MSDLITLTEGEFAGWQTWPGDNFEDMTGPFYLRHEEDGSRVCAFRVEAKHLNGSEAVHGGCMMTFADSAAFYIAHDALNGDRFVTMTMNSEFVGPAFLGELMECRGEVIRAGGRVIFVKGLISSDGRPCLNWSATLARVKRK